MSKVKVAELLIAAVTAVVTIAKGVIKLIEYVNKLKNRRPSFSVA